MHRNAGSPWDSGSSPLGEGVLLGDWGGGWISTSDGIAARGPSVRDPAAPPLLWDPLLFLPQPGQPHHIHPIKVLSPVAWREEKILWGKLKSPSLGASHQPCPIRILEKGSSVCMLRYFPQVFWMWTDLATTGLGWPADFLSSSLELFTRLPQTESTLCYFPDCYFY